jgi:hypothetical protein
MTALAATLVAPPAAREGTELCAEFAELTPASVARMARLRGIGPVTAAMCERVRASRRHGPFIRQVEETSPVDVRDAAGGAGDVTVGVVPGALYGSYPHTEADGRRLIAVARRIGCNTSLVPLHDFGPVAANARILLDWLQAHRDAGGGKVILASLSKGSAEVRRALAEPAAGAAFRDVIAWLNVSGVPDGSWMVNQMMANPWRRLVTRMTCRWVRADYNVLCELAASDAPPRWPEIPHHVRVVHVVGFPLPEHLSGRVARRNFRRLLPLGPNDGGGVLLAEALRWPGLLYPAWGADHFMRPAWDVDALVGRVLVTLLRSVPQD